MKPKRKIIPITDNIKVSIKDTRYSVHNNIIICYLYVAVNASLVDDYDRARTFTGDKSIRNWARWIGWKNDCIRCQY